MGGKEDREPRARGGVIPAHPIKIRGAFRRRQSQRFGKPVLIASGCLAHGAHGSRWAGMKPSCPGARRLPGIAQPIDLTDEMRLVFMPGGAFGGEFFEVPVGLHLNSAQFTA